MNDEIMKSILDVLQSINDNLSNQGYQLERLNENIENVTGSFKNRSFINISATVSEG